MRRPVEAGWDSWEDKTLDMPPQNEVKAHADRSGQLACILYDSGVLHTLLP